MRFRPRAAKMAVLAFGLVLALGVTACVGAGVAPGERLKIGFLVQNTKFDFTKELSEGYRAGAEISGGVDTAVIGPPTHDGPRQIQLFKELTATAKGGIAVSVSAPELLARPLAEAAASNGPPLIAVAGRPAPGPGITLLIENDNYELGSMLADEAIKRLPPQTSGKVILGTNQPALPALDQRAMGMRDQFARRLPNTRVLGPFDVQKDPQANLASWRLLVGANPDAVAFLATGDIDAISLATVRASTPGTWLTGGFSVDPRALQAVKDGRLSISISPEHFLKGVAGGWLLAEHAKRARPLPQGWLVTPGLAITFSNVDEIIRRQTSAANKLTGAQPQLDQIIATPERFLRPLDQSW
jgi:ribose transport system substrate-binding protein